MIKNHIKKLYIIDYRNNYIKKEYIKGLYMITYKITNNNNN